MCNIFLITHIYHKQCPVKIHLSYEGEEAFSVSKKNWAPWRLHGLKEGNLLMGSEHRMVHVGCVPHTKSKQHSCFPTFIRTESMEQEGSCAWAPGQREVTRPSWMMIPPNSRAESFLFLLVMISAKHFENVFLCCPVETLFLEKLL